MAAAQAKILWGGIDGPVSDLAIGAGVVLSNDDLGGEVLKQWYLVQKPAASSAVLTAGPSADERTLTPDVYGTYVVRVVVNNTMMHVSAGAVLHPSGLREPAVGETTEWNNTLGWADSAKDLWRASGMGVPLLDLTTKNTTGVLTVEEVVGRILRGETNGGIVTLDLPDLDEPHYDMASGLIVRVGSNNLILNAPAGATLRAAGAVGTTYTMADDASVVRWHYDQQNNVFYLAVSQMGGGGGGGESNTASNVGGSVEVFKQKTGVDLEFRTLQQGTRGHAEVEQLTNTVEIRSGLQYASTFASDSILTDVDIRNTLIIGDTSANPVDLDLPSLSASDDFLHFSVVRDGVHPLRLLSPSISYRILYDGYVDDQTYEMNADGDTASIVYHHSTQTYYVIG